MNGNLLLFLGEFLWFGKLQMEPCKAKANLALGGTIKHHLKEWLKN
jgi:hypothetical protein